MTDNELQNRFSIRSSLPVPRSDTLPTLAFFNIAKHTPTVVLNGIVHALMEMRSFPTQTTTNHPHFHVENLVFELLPTQSLEELEQQYIMMSATAIEAYKTDYLRKVVDQRIKTLEATQQQIAQNKVLTFLATCLIPKFQQLEMDETDSEPEKILQLLSPRLKPVINHPHSQASSRQNLLGEIFGRNVLVFDEIVYPLVSVTPVQQQDLLIQDNGRYCTPAVPGSLLADIECDYQSRLRRSLQVQALAESPERIDVLEKLETEMASLSAIAQRTDGYLYQGQEYGVVGQGGHWIAYVEVPEYAIEAADGKLYRFDSTRVGVVINSCRSRDVLAAGKAQVLTAYEHMFISSCQARSSICMVKRSAYYQQLQQMPLQDGICHYLQDAKYTLMAGYHAGNESTPHHPIGAFPHRRINRQEAARRCLPVFSYAR